MATKKEVSDDKSTRETEYSSEQECAICLQQTLHPARLPCGHVFCYLCIKGVSHRSRRCALCRQEIPAHYFTRPELLEPLPGNTTNAVLQEEDSEISNKAEEASESGVVNTWYYQGRGGWWQYDERTCIEIEKKWADGEEVFELLVAGFLYMIDLKNMVQYRHSDASRRRKIKRDRLDIQDKKGIAGLRFQPQIDVTQGNFVPGTQRRRTRAPAPTSTNGSDGLNNVRSDTSLNAPPLPMPRRRPPQSTSSHSSAARGPATGAEDASSSRVRRPTRQSREERTRERRSSPEQDTNQQPHEGRTRGAPVTTSQQEERTRRRSASEQDDTASNENRTSLQSSEGRTRQGASVRAYREDSRAREDDLASSEDRAINVETVNGSRRPNATRPVLTTEATITGSSGHTHQAGTRIMQDRENIFDLSETGRNDAVTSMRRLPSDSVASQTRRQIAADRSSRNSEDAPPLSGTRNTEPPNLALQRRNDSENRLVTGRDSESDSLTD